MSLDSRRKRWRAAVPSTDALTNEYQACDECGEQEDERDQIRFSRRTRRRSDGTRRGALGGLKHAELPQQCRDLLACVERSPSRWNDPCAVWRPRPEDGLEQHVHDGTVRRGGIRLCDDGLAQPGLIGDRDREGIAQISSWSLRRHHRLRRHMEPTDELSDVTHVCVQLAPPFRSTPTRYRAEQLPPASALAATDAAIAVTSRKIAPMRSGQRILLRG